MTPTIISDTIQEFDGVRYYKCGHYFQRKGVRLHRVVWEAIHGPVPDGMHIHHIDGDRANNALSNLECLEAEKHLGERHGDTSGQRGLGSIRKAGAIAAKWHGSDEGRKWHSDHYEKHLRVIHERRVPKVCQQCGSAYEASAVKAAYSKFCGPNCKAKALRARRRSET